MKFGPALVSCAYPQDKAPRGTGILEKRRGEIGGFTEQVLLMAPLPHR